MREKVTLEVNDAEWVTETCVLENELCVSWEMETYKVYVMKIAF